MRFLSLFVFLFLNLNGRAQLEFDSTGQVDGYFVLRVETSDESPCLAGQFNSGNRVGVWTYYDGRGNIVSRRLYKEDQPEKYFVLALDSAEIVDSVVRSYDKYEFKDVLYSKRLWFSIDLPDTLSDVVKELWKDKGLRKYANDELSEEFSKDKLDSTVKKVVLKADYFITSRTLEMTEKIIHFGVVENKDTSYVYYPFISSVMNRNNSENIVRLLTFIKSNLIARNIYKESNLSNLSIRDYTKNEFVPIVQREIVKDLLIQEALFVRKK